MMRAAVFSEPGQPLAIETLPDLAPGEGEVVVKVHRCGICGSDLHITSGHGYTTPRGTVLGHEFTGEVVAVGKGVQRLKLGDRAAAMPIFGCGHCRFCAAGEPAWCPDIRYVFGGYAEYALVNENSAVKLPASLSSADGALAEPLAVALHGVAQARLEPGAHVLIQGGGPIGLAALYWARKFGARRVDVVEGAPRRAEIALAMGADSVSHPPVAGSADFVPQQINGNAPDIVIECVGRPGLLGQAIAAVRQRGSVISLGYCFQADTIVPAAAGGKELKILFPQLYTTREFEFAVKILDDGAVEPRAMITSTVNFSTLADSFDKLRSNPTECKVLIDPHSV